MAIRAAVLAGGAASRFSGRPKGLERVGGERILDRVVQTVQEALGTPPMLVANAPAASGWRDDLAVTPDVLPDCGSLGGIYTAVLAGADPVLVLAWDMPFVPAGLLRALVDGAGDYDVFLPASEGPLEIEPLCGLYGPACAAIIQQHLEDEDFRTTGFHGELHAGILPLEEVAKHGDPATQFFNVNTTEDLAEAEELWRALHV
jgi:molybdopterin-guanine dinucleotide biosynthesis protein A